MALCAKESMQPLLAAGDLNRHFRVFTEFIRELARPGEQYPFPPMNNKCTLKEKDA